MGKNKKILLLLVAAALTAALGTELAACSNGTKGSDAPLATDGAGGSGAVAASRDMADYSILKGKTISILISQSRYFDEYKKMAKEIENDYGCKVEFQVSPDNEYYSLLKVKLSTNEVPDLFSYNFPTQNEEIGASQYCADLSQEPWIKRLVDPSFLKDGRDGKIYALPEEATGTSMAVFYNKKVMEGVGIKAPAPKTYEEFLDILQTVKDKGKGVIPFYETNAQTWTTQIFMTAGLPILLGDKAEETFEKLRTNELKWTDVTEAISLLQDFDDLVKLGYVNNDYLSASYDTAPEIMGTGKAAMYLTIENAAYNIMDKYPDASLGSFVIPFGNHKKLAVGAYVHGLFVPKGGKQVDVAKAFLDLWSQPKYHDEYYKTKPGSPAFKDVDPGEVMPAVENLITNYIKTGQYTVQLNDRFPEASTLWPDLWNLYVESISGKKTPKEVFESFQRKYQDYMEQVGAEGF